MRTPRDCGACFGSSSRSRKTLPGRRNPLPFLRWPWCDSPPCPRATTSRHCSLASSPLNDSLERAGISPRSRRAAELPGAAHRALRPVSRQPLTAHRASLQPPSRSQGLRPYAGRGGQGTRASSDYRRQRPRSPPPRSEHRCGCSPRSRVRPLAHLCPGRRSYRLRLSRCRRTPRTQRQPDLHRCRKSLPCQTTWCSRRPTQGHLCEILWSTHGRGNPDPGSWDGFVTNPRHAGESDRQRRKTALDHPAINTAIQELDAQIVEIRPIGERE